MNHYPFLNPHVAAQGQPTQSFAYEDRTTAQQQFNKIVEEVMSKKNKEKINQNAVVGGGDEQKKCKMHPVRPSKTCRECRSLAQSVPKTSSEPSKVEPYGDRLAEQRGSSDYFELNCQQPLSHLNEKLKKNIQGFEYFRELYSLRTFQEVVIEIESQCRSVETFQKGSTEIPTKFMCCFYKLLLMRLVAKQVRALLEHSNLYVKAAGLLYVRMLCAYEQLYDWLSPFLDCEEDFYPNVDKSEVLTIGEYATRLFKELDHFQLRLPRIPTKIDKEIQQKLATRVHHGVEKPQQQLVERIQPEGHSTQAQSASLGIVAVMVLNGKKISLKVKELAADKVLAWHPETGHVVELEYEAVDLEDEKASVPQKSQTRVESKPVKKEIRKSRSRSRSSRKHKHSSRREKKSDKRKHQKDRHRRRRSSSRSSSRSSRSSSNSRRRSPSSSKKDRAQLHPQPAPQQKSRKVVTHNQLAPPPAYANIDTLKASIKRLTATSNQPEGSQRRLDAGALLKYKEMEDEDAPTWKDPVLEQEGEEIVRMG